MDVKSELVNINGSRFYYEIAGEGDTLVLIHGSSTDTRMWDDQFRPFSEHFQVLRYDMRGHGQSDQPSDEPYSHASDLNMLLEHLDIKKAHMAGLSSGGTAVIDFALLHPDKTSSLIPISAGPTGRPSTKSSTHEIDKAIRLAFNTSGKPAASKIAYEHPVFNPAVMNPLSSKRMKQYLDEAKDWWRMSRKDPGKVEESSQITRLNEISVPTLVIVGELDIPEMGPASDSIVNGIPEARKVSMLNCGHMVNMEDPDTFNKILLEFLRQI